MAGIIENVYSKFKQMLVNKVLVPVTEISKPPDIIIHRMTVLKLMDGYLLRMTEAGGIWKLS